MLVPHATVSWTRCGFWDPYTGPREQYKNPGNGRVRHQQSRQCQTTTHTDAHGAAKQGVHIVLSSIIALSSMSKRMDKRILNGHAITPIELEHLTRSAQMICQQIMKNMANVGLVTPSVGPQADSEPPLAIPAPMTDEDAAEMMDDINLSIDAGDSERLASLISYMKPGQPDLVRQSARDRLVSCLESALWNDSHQKLDTIVDAMRAFHQKDRLKNIQPLILIFTEIERKIAPSIASASEERIAQLRASLKHLTDKKDETLQFSTLARLIGKVQKQITIGR